MSQTVTTSNLTFVDGEGTMCTCIAYVVLTYLALIYKLTSNAGLASLGVIVRS